MKTVPVLPPSLPVKATLFGRGANGYAMQTRVNTKYGITVISVRERHGAEWVHELFIDCLPDQTFKSYQEMREALALLE